MAASLILFEDSQFGEVEIGAAEGFVTTKTAGAVQKAVRKPVEPDHPVVNLLAARANPAAPI